MVSEKTDWQKQKKVLVVHNYYQIPGGEDTVVANEIRMLKEHGYEVLFYSRDNRELKDYSGFRKVLSAFGSIFSFRTYREVKKQIQENGIDLVHVHNTLCRVSPSVYYAALSCHVPVVQTVHNFRLLCPGALFYRDGKVCEDCIRKGLGCAVRHKCYRDSRLQTLVAVFGSWIHRLAGIYGKINYICLTEFGREKLLSLKQIRPERVFVKPNFTKTDLPFLQEKERKNQFVYAGRLDPTKGLETLLVAWKKMGETAPKLIICGIGPLEEWCRTYIGEQGLNVELRGFVENKDVLRLLSESRGLVLPTRLYEGFPMSIVEAFSVGTPVVCSDLGNAGSIVKEGVTGCKFAPDSAEELQAAVLRVKGMCEGTKQAFEEAYSEEVNFKQLESIYREIC